MSIRVVAGVMARAPVPGRCKTRLARTIGEAGAARLYAAMLTDTWTALHAVPGLSVVVMAAPEDDGPRQLAALLPGARVLPQRGAGLEARVQAALLDLAPGAAAVLLTGSDTPTPPCDALGERLAWLRGGGRALIAPTLDGGYWCIGLSTPPALQVVSDIPWSTAAVAATTRERCRAAGVELAELPVSYDVDEVEDLAAARAALVRDPAAAPRTRSALAELGLL